MAPPEYVLQIDFAEKRKPDPCGSGFSFAGAGASNHLPEGNSRQQRGCHLGEKQPFANDESQYADAPALCNL
jgi:hypothetical protein